MFTKIVFASLIAVATSISAFAAVDGQRPVVGEKSNASVSALPPIVVAGISTSPSRGSPGPVRP